MQKANEPGIAPRPGVLLGGEPGSHSATTLQHQILTRFGISPRMAEILSPLVWTGGRANG